MTPEQRKAMREAAERAQIGSLTDLISQAGWIQYVGTCSPSAVLALLAERDALEQQLAACHAEPAPADLVEVVAREVCCGGQCTEGPPCPGRPNIRKADRILAVLSDRLLKPGHVQVPVAYKRACDRLTGGVFIDTPSDKERADDPA